MSSYPKCKHGVGDANNLVECKDCLIEDLTAENERLKEQLRWIPVSERLPEAYVPVEIYIPRLKEMDMAKLETNDELHDFFGFKGAYTKEVVSHWRPITLPEAKP